MKQKYETHPSQNVVKREIIGDTLIQTFEDGTIVQTKHKIVLVDRDQSPNRAERRRNKKLKR